MAPQIPFTRKADTAGPPQPPARGFPEDRLNTVLEICFPEDMTHRKKEVDTCLEIARHYDLNPLLQEIRFVQSSSYEHGRKVWTVKPLVGRDGFIALAHRSGQYGGINTAVEFKPWPFFDRASNTWQLHEQPVATCEVYRRDTTIPTTVTVGFWEYAAKEDGYIPEFWQRLGVTMTCKVAECQALRKAFNLSGLYSPEELSVGFIDAEGDLQTPEKTHKDQPGEKSQTTSEAPATPQSTEQQPTALSSSNPIQSETELRLEKRLERARDILTRRFGFQDVTLQETLILDGKVMVDADSFIMRKLGPLQASILAWVPPSSPNSTILADYGFQEDTASQWWTLELSQE